METVAKIASSTFFNHPLSPAKSPTSSESSTRSEYSSSSWTSEEDSIISPPELIGSLIYKNPGGSPRLPCTLYSGIYHHIAHPGNVWVNKLAFGSSLRYRSSAGVLKLPTFHCPKGFGKTAFLDMAAFQNDTSREREYSEYFGESQSRAIPEDEDRLVLCLDFGEFPPSANPQKLRRVLDDHVTTALTLFLELYGHILSVPEESISDFVTENAGDRSLEAVLRLLRVPYANLYVFVDNFNVPLINCKPADVDAVSRLLQDYLVWPVRDGIDAGLISGGCFFGRPEDEIPTYAMEAHGIFDIVCADLSDDEDMSGAVGLAAPEIKALAHEILGVGKDAFVAKVRKALKPYYMANTPRYSFTGVFGLLKKQTGQEEPQLQPGVITRFDDPYSIAHEDQY